MVLALFSGDALASGLRLAIGAHQGNKARQREFWLYSNQARAGVAVTLAIMHAFKYIFPVISALFPIMILSVASPFFLALIKDHTTRTRRLLALSHSGQ